ncbi:MAG: hypothetical protein GY906_26575, partial [bacterium]|nr:hypothetical protein [bacterium]
DPVQGGVLLSNTEHIQVVGNFLHDLNPSQYGYIGIRGSTHDNVDIIVRNNTIYRVQGTGISLVGKRWLVEDNEVSHSLDTNTDTGTHVGGDSDAIRFMGSQHVIRNNYLHDSLDEEQLGDPHIDAFQTFSVYPDSQFAFDILIEGNYCVNFGQMLMIEDNSQASGGVDAVHHVTLRNNIFWRTRAGAINGGHVEHFTFVNNVVADITYFAVGLQLSPYLTVENNIFYHDTGSQILDEESKIGSRWDYNIYFPDFAWPPKQPEFDQHSMFGVDPDFVAPGMGDFHPGIDSPARDMGHELPGFNYDHDGLARPQNFGWDIGAYEYPVVIFSDDFESGDVLRWSSAQH